VWSSAPAAAWPVRIAFTPARPGEFEFVCDVFCGSGHEDMTGTLVVVP